MSMMDEEGYLVKLSQRVGMNLFKNVILVAAYNDGYVNYDSAKILYDKNPNSNKILLQMA